MKDPYQPFTAKTNKRNGAGHYIQPQQTADGLVMCIRTIEGDVYISKQQVIDFFGLTNPNDYLSRI